MNDVFCSPDVSIFVCKMLGENLLLAKWKLSIWKSKKIHIPNMSLSCDIYRWQVYKKAITKFCYKDNVLYLSRVCFLIVLISLQAACVVYHSFLSLTFLLQNLLCWLLFCRKIWKLFLVAHFGFIVVLCILVDYSLFMPPSKERFKGICPVVNLCEFFRQKTLERFFCKKDPKKKTLSDFLIFDLGTTNCFIANSLLSPLLHVKIHASVGYRRPCYALPSKTQ